MAATFAEAAEHEVTCPICLEFFADPRIPKVLKCSHTCCQVCLQSMVTLNPGQPIKCPSRCPETTPVPAGGVASLTTNRRLKNLAEQHPNYAKGPRHTVPKCAHHEGEKTHLFCVPCNKLACQNCILAFHQGTPHEVKDIKVMCKDLKPELDTAVRDVHREVNERKQCAQKIKKIIQIKHTNLESEKRLIDHAAEDIISAVRKERDTLKSELQNSVEVDLTKLHGDVARHEEQAKKLEAAYKVANQTAASSDYAYITQHVSLVDRMKNLAVKEDKPDISVTQLSAKFVQINNSDVKLGKVERPGPKKSELVQKIDGCDYAYGLVGSPNGLLAFSEFHKKQVLVYRKQDGQYTKHLSLSLPSSNTNKPCGVSAFVDGKFLVARCTGIEVYSAIGAYQKTIKTTNDNTTKTNVWSVVTKTDGRILAGDVIRCVITEHEPTGTIIRTIKTSIQPYHMTLIHDTHIAISERQTGKVSVMDIQSGQETLSIDIPEVEGICYDEQTECLLTVRSEPDSEPRRLLLNTGVIEQYCCTTGRLVACLAQGLYHPQDMGFLSDGNLAIADQTSVKIYSISIPTQYT